LNFLIIDKPNLVNSFRKEKFGTLINKIKTSQHLESVSSDTEVLDNILEHVNKTKNYPEIPESVMKQFIKCKENPKCNKYVQSRGLIPEDDWFFSEQTFFIYNEKKVFLKNYLIIPIYRDNKYVGFYSRSIEEKKFSTFLLDGEGIDKVWMSKPNMHYKDIELVAEGIFDALSTTYEYTAAMISASMPPKAEEELSKNTIFVYDNDSTGIQKAIKQAQKGFKVFVPPNELDELGIKDLNELLISGRSKEQITDLIQRNTYKGIEAITRLKMKQI
jgi:hypothetical protein